MQRKSRKDEKPNPVGMTGSRPSPLPHHPDAGWPRYRSPFELDFPKWREAALRETVTGVAAGEEQQADWDEAQRLLR